ncbi:MAG: tRNA1(Val) (adenine(37)-N6)-methyltransferase [Flavobacteriales bacterium]
MSSFEFKQFTINQKGAPFKVGTDSLIFGAWLRLIGTETVLDIGTGTGVLALMTAQNLTVGRVLAIEPEREAFLIAEQNVSSSAFRHAVVMVNEPLQRIAPNAPFDLIISNPPYFSHSTKNTKASSTRARHTESLQFLDIVKFSSQWLKPEGKLAVVLPYEESKVFQSLMEEKEFFLVRELQISSFENTTVKRRCLEFSRIKSGLFSELLAIRDKESGVYSKDYKRLTKEYHLKL